MKIRKILFSSIVLFAYICSSPTNVFAHDNVTSYSHDPTRTGWDVFENSIHCASYTQNINVSRGDFSTSHAFTSYITSAINAWNNATFQNTDLVNMTSDNTNGSVVFKKKTSAEIIAVIGSSSWAFVYRSNAVNDGTGKNHYSTNANSVEIWVNWDDVLVNKSANAKNHTARHELGHVIGLVDIPNSISYNMQWIWFKLYSTDYNN